MRKVLSLMMIVLGLCVGVLSACAPSEPAVTLTLSQEQVVLSEGESKMVFATLTKDGQEIPCVVDFALSEESETDVVTMTVEQESATVSYEKAGSVKIVCTATAGNKTYKKEITVVCRGSVALEKSVFIEYALGNAFVLPDEVEGEVTDVLYDGASVFTSVSDEGITLNMESFAQGKLEKKLIIKTETADYQADAEYVAMVINDADELFVMQDVAYELGDHNENAPTLEGYFVLGNDVLVPNNYVYEMKYRSKDWDGGFRGTLDGRGYRIDGLTMYDSTSLFYAYLGDGVGLKDILFTNCVKRGGGTFMCAYRDSAWENVYIHMKQVVCSQDTAIIQHENHGTSKSMRNVMVVVDELVDGTNAGLAVFSMGTIKWQNRNVNDTSRCRAINCAFVCGRDFLGVDIHGLYTMPTKGDDKYYEELPFTGSKYALNEKQEDWDSDFWIVDEGTPYPISDYYW